MSNASFKTQWQIAIRESDLQGATRGILFALSTYAKPDGSDCYPSTETLSQSSGFTRRTVETHLAIAEKSGWIERTQRIFKGQKWANYSYKLTEKGCEGVTHASEKVGKMVQEGWENDDVKDGKEVPTNIKGNITKNIKVEFSRITESIEGIIAPSRLNPVEALRAFRHEANECPPEKIADAVISFYQDQKGIEAKYIAGLAKVIREKSYQPFLNAKSSVPKLLASNGWDLVHKGKISEDQLYGWIGRYELGQVSDLSEFSPLPENVTPIENHRKVATQQLT